MDDLIRREDALSCFHLWIDTYGDLQTAEDMPEYMAIEALPSARPQGRWIYYSDGACKCSECLTSYGRLDTPFCPNCGAEMRGEKDE